MQSSEKRKRGRPKTGNDQSRPVVQIRFIAEDLERLDVSKSKAGFATRSEFARILINEALNAREQAQG